MSIFGFSLELQSAISGSLKGFFLREGDLRWWCICPWVFSEVSPIIAVATVHLLFVGTRLTGLNSKANIAARRLWRGMLLPCLMVPQWLDDVSWFLQALWFHWDMLVCTSLAKLCFAWMCWCGMVLHFTMTCWCGFVSRETYLVKTCWHGTILMNNLFSEDVMMWHRSH